ncbi:protein of unknown function, might belong to Transposase [Moritella yayanosii]|uniref:Transposase IS4 N-terminal domain-containing protein n=1 Tax=Moritella yayanosii TaxID=69539 RepID=A0A330LMA1_9GAMM|nr:protein of unknown function, might belong to Transposase [Moritella yayanosii]
MVWLLVGMALYNDKSMADIVNQLDIVDRTGKAFVAPSALTQRRKNLGEDAMKAVLQLYYSSAFLCFSLSRQEKIRQPQ